MSGTGQDQAGNMMSPKVDHTCGRFTLIRSGGARREGLVRPDDGTARSVRDAGAVSVTTSALLCVIPEKSGK